MIVRELLTKIGFSVNDANLRKYERSVDNIKESAQQAADAFTSMVAAFAGFAALQSLANVADQMQSIETRLGMLPQSVDGAAAAFDYVAERAGMARQSIEAYSDFYLKAGNATQDFIKDQETLTKVVDATAYGLAASGSTAAAQSQAFFQLGQAIGSPAVQMEEMNTLIDVAPDLFRALGKAIPGANGNLKKFIGTGNVTGKMLAEGLIAVLPQFEAQMKQMPMSIGTATVLIGNRWGAFVNRLNRESGAVTTVANLFLDAFDKIESGLDSVVQFFGGATNTLKFFAIVITAAVLPAMVRMGAGLIAFLVSPAGLLLAALVLVGLALEDFYVWLNGGDSVLRDIFGSSENFKNSLMGIWEWLKKVANTFYEAFSWGYILGDTFKALHGLWSMIKAIASALMAVGKIAAAAFSFDLSGMKAGFAQLGGAIKNFAAGSNNLLTGGIGAAVGIGVGASRLIMGQSPAQVAQNNNINIQMPPGTTNQQVESFKQSIGMASGSIPYLPSLALLQGQ